MRRIIVEHTEYRSLSRAIDVTFCDDSVAWSQVKIKQAHHSREYAASAENQSESTTRHDDIRMRIMYNLMRDGILRCVIQFVHQ